METFIKGKMEGWSTRTTYKLGDGTKWRLRKPKNRAFKRNNPRVKLWTDDRENHYLEIVGMVGKVAVSQIM